MPGTTIPPVPHYEPAPATKEERKWDNASGFRFRAALTDVGVSIVEWADFPIIDLSKAKSPEGRAELAPVVREAMRTYGFLYIINHGLTAAQVHNTLPSSIYCERTLTR